MRRNIILSILLVLLLSGCMSQGEHPTAQEETIHSTIAEDLDGDGSSDYFIITFSEHPDIDAGLVFQRKILASAITSAEYVSYDNISDADLIIAEEKVTDFSNSLKVETDGCSRNIGLLSVNCIDIGTCSKLCSSSSTKCRALIPAYGDAIGSSMISYGQTLNELDSLVFDAKRKARLLKSSPEEKPTYLLIIREIVGKVAELRANPVYSAGWDLCHPTSLDFGPLNYASGTVGNFSTYDGSFHYVVLVTATPLDEAADELRIADVGLKDSVQKDILSGGVSSHQEVQISENSRMELVWEPKKISDTGYAFLYEFDSPAPPETITLLFQPPVATVKTLDLTIAQPVGMMFSALRSLTGDFYLSMGLSFGVVLSLLMLLYTLAVLLLSVAKAKIAGISAEKGVRRAFGRSAVSWKTDMVFAVLFLVGSVIISASLAVQPPQPTNLLEAPDIFITEIWGAVAFALSLLGVFLVYLAAENYSKILILEKAYGKVLREKKISFLDKVSKVKENLAMLEKMIEEYGKEGFDVSKEYDVLASVSASKADQLAKVGDSRARRMIDDYLTKLENSIERLSEKKRVAEEDWPKWKQTIAKMLKESNEVYANSLVTIPASLRGWALGKYAKEHPEAGLVFERDSLKKKEVTPVLFVQQLIEDGLIVGAVVVKNDKVVVSEFLKGSGSVRGILTQKLQSYLRLVSKQLGRGEPASFAAIGKHTVLVLLAERRTRSLLFVNRSRFKEAIESWKRNKMRITGS